MLAEMGDRMFELGHVSDATYRSLILSDKLVELVGSSLTQCAPECTNCVFEFRLRSRSNLPLRDTARCPGHKAVFGILFPTKRSDERSFEVFWISLLAMPLS